MRSACVSIVRNEADIIEVFVRYHAKVFDHVFVMDHHSRDGTSEILAQLVREGLPLTVSTKDAPYHVQGEAVTQLLKEVRRKHRPIVLMPLDADEFVVGNVVKATHELLSPGDTLAVLWHNYAPTTAFTGNPLEHIVYRSQHINPNQHKPLIPGTVLDHDVFLLEGCHEVYASPGEMVRLVICKNLHLAHFPIRSAQQLMKKALVGWTAKIANPHNNGSNPDWSHWKLFFDKVKRGYEPSILELRNLALGYSTDRFSDPSLELVREPVDCSGIDIKYPCDGRYAPLEAMADAAELLAYRLGLALRPA